MDLEARTGPAQKAQPLVTLKRFGDTFSKSYLEYFIIF
jgi:hypothetical protein